MPAHLLKLLDSKLASTASLVVPMNQLADLVVETLAFTIVGLLLFALAFWIIVKVSPFSIRKEIEEDQNMALGIVIAAVIIGIALSFPPPCTGS